MANKQVLVGSGVAILGAGILLMYMGVKDYTFTDVIQSVINQKPLPGASPPATGGAADSEFPQPSPSPSPQQAIPPSKDIPTPSPHPGPIPTRPAFNTGVDGINWGGDYFA